MRDFYKDFEEFCGKYSNGTIYAYKIGYITMAEALATLLDNKNLDDIRIANSKPKFWRVQWLSEGRLKERDCTTEEKAEEWKNGLIKNGFDEVMVYEVRF